MFDGAAATAAEQHHNDDGSGNPSSSSHASTADPAALAPSSAAPAAAGTSASSATPAPAAAPATLNLVVIDSRIEGSERLAARLPANARLLVVDTQTDGLAAISAALAELGHVDSIQIFSHGGSGQFTLGSRTLSSDNIDAAASLLAGWRAELQPGADIQLYGCNVGSGAAGQALVG